MKIMKWGRLLTSAGVNAMMNDIEFIIFVNESLRRYSIGDWGEIGEEDKRMNDRAVKTGSRILASYDYSDNTRIWIITEADRSSTTILFPKEY